MFIFIGLNVNTYILFRILFKIIKQFFRPGGATSSGTTSSGGSENTLYNITGKIGLKNLNS